MDGYALLCEQQKKTAFKNVDRDAPASSQDKAPFSVNTSMMVLRVKYNGEKQIHGESEEQSAV